MQVKYTLGPSTITEAGRGIFAAEFIPKGTLVWKWRQIDHVIFSDAEQMNDFLTNKPDEEIRSILEHTYGFHGFVMYELDAHKYTNHHATEYNVGHNHDLPHDEKLWKIFALKDIQEGDEFFENYARELEKSGPSWWQKLVDKYRVPFFDGDLPVEFRADASPATVKSVS